jgi:hypothetical protein
VLERHAVLVQMRRQLDHIGLHDLQFYVVEGIETEDEVERVGLNAGQRQIVIENEIIICLSVGVELLPRFRIIQVATSQVRQRLAGANYVQDVTGLQIRPRFVIEYRRRGWRGGR